MLVCYFANALNLTLRTSDENSDDNGGEATHGPLPHGRGSDSGATCW